MEVYILFTVLGILFVLSIVAFVFVVLFFAKKRLKPGDSWGIFFFGSNVVFSLFALVFVVLTSLNLFNDLRTSGWIETDVTDIKLLEVISDSGECYNAARGTYGSGGCVNSDTYVYEYKYRDESGVEYSGKYSTTVGGPTERIKYNPDNHSESLIADRVYLEGFISSLLFLAFVWGIYAIIEKIRTRPKKKSKK